MESVALKFGPDGLLPAIAQDAETGEVLMLAYMNQASVDETLKTGFATYYSRSRKALWKKGETSGHLQKVLSISYDCDEDALLLQVEQTGPACHTGERSCFYRTLSGEAPAGPAVLHQVRAVIADRKRNPKEGSYTNYLFQKGLAKIAKKVGEEATEVVVAAMQQDREEILYESADLLYHLLVLLEEQDIPLSELWAELSRRR